MAIYSIREVSDLTGIPEKNIHTYIGRKKLIKNGNKKIDTSDIVNQIFIQKYSKQPIPNERVSNPSPKKETIKADDTEDKVSSASATAMVEIDYAIKQLRAKLLEKDNEVRETELLQKKGQLINMEKVVEISGGYSEAFKRKLLERLKTFVQDICTRHEIDSGKTGEYKLKIASIINESSEKATKQLLRDFKDI